MNAMPTPCRCLLQYLAAVKPIDETELQFGQEKGSQRADPVSSNESSGPWMPSTEKQGPPYYRMKQEARVQRGTSVALDW